MPDANMEATLSALVDAGFGTAGRTCLAIDIVVSVGSSILWYIDSFVYRNPLLPSSFLSFWKSSS